jgi:ABC-type nickel/cobalt efflux system permease component RcnA
VLASAEEMKDAAVGAPSKSKEKRDAGLDQSAVAEYLTRNASQLDQLQLPGSAQALAQQTAATLLGLAQSLAQATTVGMEDLERRLTIAEEKLFAALLAATPDEALYQVRSEADRDLAPYRRKMTAPQIEHLHKQYIHKRLFEQYRVPRLSLFYM